MKCPHCKKEINESDIAKHFASKGGKVGGKVKNKKRAAASRANGKLGGRPKKKKD
jgi:hypothetical protein|tara:strand:- start:659 stop:823 length:165 start_codon:yes stop_codon:yes gene_type:complete